MAGAEAPAQAGETECQISGRATALPLASAQAPPPSESAAAPMARQINTSCVARRSGRCLALLSVVDMWRTFLCLSRPRLRSSLSRCEGFSGAPAPPMWGKPQVAIAGVFGDSLSNVRRQCLAQEATFKSATTACRSGSCATLAFPAAAALVRRACWRFRGIVEPLVAHTHKEKNLRRFAATRLALSFGKRLFSEG